MRSPSDHFPDQIEAVVRASVTGGQAAGRSTLEKQGLAYPVCEIPLRKAVPRAVAIDVFLRDRFRCCYCGGKTIFTPVMQLLGLLYPDEFPYHPNWKGGKTHPAVIARSAVVDHVNPGAWTGAWDDRENLVTACWPCNAIKADLTLEQLGWELVAPPEGSAWRGLTEYYRELWQRARRPAGHDRWLRALSSAARTEA